MTPEIIQQTLAKLGAMLMVGFLGTTPQDESVQLMGRHIEDGKVGAVLLLGRNTQDGPQKLKELSAFFQKKAKAQSPLLVAIDGEGGCIKRLLSKDGYVELPSAKKLAKMPEEESKVLLQKYMQQLAGLGINWNLAPVVDTEVETEKGCIGRLERSFSRDPEIAVKYSRKFIEAIQKSGMAFCLKHWPGLGADTGDTHQGMTDLTEVWDQKRDMEPFNLLVSEIHKENSRQIIPVMTAHSVHKKLDEESPSLTFSVKVIQEQRAKWPSDILFVSDDLEMGALDDFELGDKIIRAIMAGNDVLIISQYRNYHPQKVDKIFQHVEKTLHGEEHQARALSKRIDESYERIQQFKKFYF